MNDLWLEETYGQYEDGVVGLVSNGAPPPMPEANK